MTPPGTAARVLWFVAAGSCVPWLAGVLGLDLTIAAAPIDLEALAATGAEASSEALLRHHAGPFVHTLLEWTAVSAAIVTAALAFLNFRLTGDRVAPVVGLALFSAGLLDAFHALVATRLVAAETANVDLMPFTWAISRTFNAAVTLAGAGLLLARPPAADRDAARELGFIIAAGAVFALVASGIIHVCTRSERLPHTLYPEAFVARPWDVGALVLFVIAGATVLPLLHRRAPSPFSTALWASAFPHAAAQAHMAVGSHALYDHHFNVGHALKAAGYLLPLLGLVAEYARTYRDERRIRLALEAANREMEEFSYTMSHDLRAPVRHVLGFAGKLRRHAGEALDDEARRLTRVIEGSARHMGELVDGLLVFLRASRTTPDSRRLPLDQLVGELVSEARARSAGRAIDWKVGPLPVVLADPALLRIAIGELLANAVKFTSGREVSRIQIGEHPDPSPGQRVIFVRDDGVGFDMKYAERIFEVFQTLHRQDEFEGTGIGLANVQRIASRHGGRAWAQAAPGHGATFFLALPSANGV